MVNPSTRPLLGKLQAFKTEPDLKKTPLQQENKPGSFESLTLFHLEYFQNEV